MSKPKLNEIYRSVVLENNDGKVEDMIGSEELKGLDSLKKINQKMIKDYIKSHLTQRLDHYKSTTDNEAIIQNINSISEEDIENIAVKGAEENKNVPSDLFIDYAKSFAQLRKLVKGEGSKEEKEERPVQSSEEKQKDQSPITVKDNIGIEYDIPTADGIYKVHNPNGLKSIVYIEIKTDIPEDNSKEKITTKKVLLIDKSPSKEDLDSLSKNTYVKISEDQRKRILTAVSAGGLKHDLALSKYDLSEVTQNINSNYKDLGRDDPKAIKETINAKLDMILYGVKNSGSAGRYLRGLAVNSGGLFKSAASSKTENDGYIKIDNMWSAFGVYHNITRDLSEKNLMVYAPKGKDGDTNYSKNIIDTILGGMVENILPHLVSSIKRLLVPSNKRNPFYAASAKIPDKVAKILSSMVYGEDYNVTSRPNPKYGSYQKMNGNEQIERGYDGNIYLALNYKNISADIDQSKFTYDDISNWLSSGADKTISEMLRNSAAEQTHEKITNDAKRITKFVFLAQEAINRITGDRFLDFMGVPEGGINQVMNKAIESHNSKSYTNDAVEEIIHKSVKISYEDTDNDGNQDGVVVGSRTYSAQTDRESSIKSMAEWFDNNKESNQKEYEDAKAENWYKIFSNYYNTIRGESTRSKDLSIAKGKEITDGGFFFSVSRHASFARECLYKTFAELNKSGKPNSSFSYSDEGSKTPDAFVSDIMNQVMGMVNDKARRLNMHDHEAIKDIKKEDSIKRALQTVIADEASDKIKSIIANIKHKLDTRTKRMKEDGATQKEIEDDTAQLRDSLENYENKDYANSYKQDTPQRYIIYQMLSEILSDFPEYYIPEETKKVAEKVFQHLEKRFDSYLKDKPGFAQSKVSDNKEYVDKESSERVYGGQEDATIGDIKSDAEDLNADQDEDEYEDDFDEDEYEDDFDEDLDDDDFV